MALNYNVKYTQMHRIVKISKKLHVHLTQKLSVSLALTKIYDITFISLV